jgi:ankyrin repeat protein
MELSKRECKLFESTGDPSVSVKLGAFLKEHLDADVNLYQNANGMRALHFAAGQGNSASMRLLIG